MSNISKGTITVNQDASYEATGLAGAMFVGLAATIPPRQDITTAQAVAALQAIKAIANAEAGALAAQLQDKTQNLTQNLDHTVDRSKAWYFYTQQAGSNAITVSHAGGVDGDSIELHILFKDAGSKAVPIGNEAGDNIVALAATAGDGAALVRLGRQGGQWRCRALSVFGTCVVFSMGQAF